MSSVPRPRPLTQGSAVASRPSLASGGTADGVGSGFVGVGDGSAGSDGVRLVDGLGSAVGRPVSTITSSTGVSSLIARNSRSAFSSFQITRFGSQGAGQDGTV